MLRSMKSKNKIIPFHGVGEIRTAYNGAHQHNYSLLRLPCSRGQVLYSNPLNAGAKV